MLNTQIWNRKSEPRKGDLKTEAGGVEWIFIDNENRWMPRVQGTIECPDCLGQVQIYRDSEYEGGVPKHDCQLENKFEYGTKSAGGLLIEPKRLTLAPTE